MLMQPNIQPSTLPKDAPAKFYLYTNFGLSFMISSVAPPRSSTFHAYLITKIGNCNLNDQKHLRRGMASIKVTGDSFAIS